MDHGPEETMTMTAKILITSWNASSAVDPRAGRQGGLESDGFEDHLQGWSVSVCGGSNSVCVAFRRL